MMGPVPSGLPEDVAAPVDGSLPSDALDTVGTAPFGIYVHVPFCSVRCGYCDFNIYTASELGDTRGAARATYAKVAIDEIRLARKVIGDHAVAVDTVFFGGGTPTLLPADDLIEVLSAIRDEFGLAPGAEISTESNPDSVTAADLVRLREGGINRVSFGMQSAVPSVLRVLDRTHDPDHVTSAVTSARDAGFDQVSLDLLYGTPGESLDDWARSLDAAIACGPDHVSAYALIVEEGTALARRIARGDLEATDDDDLADKYELCDEVLAQAGYEWYEVSNWARDDARCRHNLGYWTGATWWGVGPGAHSHVGGVRWWNVKHPAAYADRIAAGVSPADEREVLDPETRLVERVLLESRLSTGLRMDLVQGVGRDAVPGLLRDGLAERSGESLVLTRRGRLLADAVVHALLP